MPHHVVLSPAVEDRVPRELIKRFQDAGTLWCARCSRRIERSEPVVVVVYRDSRADMTCLMHVHSGCGASEVIEGDLTTMVERLTEDVSLVAFVTAQQGQTVPALIVVSQAVAVVADNGELVDVAIASMLNLGFHLVTSISQLPARPSRTGWKTRLAHSDAGVYAVEVIDADGQFLVARGEVRASEQWGKALSSMLPLYVTTAPLTSGADLGAELTAAANAGRLVGAAVPMTMATVRQS